MKTTTKKGSSPRVRGKALGGGADGFFCRIIPAGAGKSLSAPIDAIVERDHPRGCGEKGAGSSA